MLFKVLGHVESQRWGWSDGGSGPFTVALLFNSSAIKASLVPTKAAFSESQTVESGRFR